ncbi:hypothetical protein MTR_8g008750 [Medicago truncatula]|uniref:Uncharacterized protein n=1 Tax=Medicago truncatula TaxID=3880 RepID=G7LCI2_MEDTR|nr:hypothetical protein MTR_8g008750 [Medicago truncatula]
MEEKICDIVSRVTSREELKILISDEDGEDTNVTSNAVYEEVFRNLYVVVSRVTSREGLKILNTNEDGEDTNVTSNVVYEEVFRNV